MTDEARNKKWFFLGLAVVAAIALVAYFGFGQPPAEEEAAGDIAAAQRHRSETATERTEIPVDEGAVDCLLPGQVRKLGSRFTSLTPRRLVRTSPTDCEIRGGEPLV